MIKENGKLFLVSTPIGNLKDITIRAVETLKDVDIIAAEDTRQTLKLLNHFNISKPLISYYRHNENIRKNELIELLKDGKNIAVVSDAGTPGISDPGEEIVQECIKNKINIIPIPGPCAAIEALICSGIDTKEFVFIGFLPTNKKNRKLKLNEIEKSTKTIILYESPHKINQTLEDLRPIIQEREVCLAREITKIHEEFIRGNIDEIIEKALNTRGEMVIVIEGKEEKQENKFMDLTLEQHYEYYKNQGLDEKDIVKKIAKDRQTNKNEIYMYFIKKKKHI